MEKAICKNCSHELPSGDLPVGPDGSEYCKGCGHDEFEVHNDTKQVVVWFVTCNEGKDFSHDDMMIECYMLKADAIQRMDELNKTCQDEGPFDIELATLELCSYSKIKIN
jgi:hypothetical protein